MKTYLTVALYFLVGSCLIFCILLPLPSLGHPEKDELVVKTPSQQINVRDTAASVKRRGELYLKRRAFALNKLGSSSAAAQSNSDLPTNGGSESSGVLASASSTTSASNGTSALTEREETTTTRTTTSAPTTVESTTTEPVVTENVTTVVPLTTGTKNSTTSSSASRTESSGSVQTTTAEPANVQGITIDIIIGVVVAIVIFILALAVITVLICCYITCWSKRSMHRRTNSIVVSDDGDEVELQSGEYLDDVNDFLEKHRTEYTKSYESLKQRELGSRLKKRWYSEVCQYNSHKKKLLTVGPVYQSCPLKLQKEKYRNGLKEILVAIKEHPYLHPIEYVEVYNIVHKDEQLKETHLLLMVQPFVHSGSLKDMIHNARPLKSWPNKYSQRSTSGIPAEKVAPYGRQILEAMKFLYSQGFPTLGHVQTGNIFVVNDVCQLGGYENTLLGYKTRLFRLCKDDLQHFDIILFGHVMFEMVAGYELTQLRPSETDYTAVVNMEVRQVLWYIFMEGFPHNINEISQHEFFRSGVSLPELDHFDQNKIQLSEHSAVVLKKVRKESTPQAAEGDGHDAISGNRFRFPKWPWKNPLKGLVASKKERQSQEYGVNPQPLLSEQNNRINQ